MIIPTTTSTVATFTVASIVCAPVAVTVSATATEIRWDDQDDTAAGTREPRRPVPPTLRAVVALELPT